MFAVVNTYRRRNALIAAGEYLAADRVASREAVKNDPDLKTQAADELDRASRDFGQTTPGRLPARSLARRHR